MEFAQAVDNSVHNIFEGRIKRRKSHLGAVGQMDFLWREIGAGNEARTRDLNLGKVALYQLSYSRVALGVKPEKPLML